MARMLNLVCICVTCMRVSRAGVHDSEQDPGEDRVVRFDTGDTTASTGVSAPVCSPTRACACVHRLDKKSKALALRWRARATGDRTTLERTRLLHPRLEDGVLSTVMRRSWCSLVVRTRRRDGDGEGRAGTAVVRLKVREEEQDDTVSSRSGSYCVAAT
jgi:hypothetical protein